MRQTTSRATRRERVQESQDVGQFRAVSPRFVRAGDAGASNAFALAEALGVASRVAPQIQAARDSETRTQAASDFQLGEVDEDLRERNAIYNQSVTRMEVRAGWIEDEKEFDEAIRSFQLEDYEPEEQAGALDRAIDDLFKSKYDGLDDADMAEFLLPQMERYRAEKQEELLAEQQRVFRERQMAAFQTVTRDMVGAAREAAREANPDAEPFELTAGATFDFDGLHDELMAQFTGREANEMFFEILKDSAIRSGDPELLRRIPDRWSDGTPSIKAIPSFNERLLNAEARAENQRAQLAKAHAKATEDAVEAEVESVALSTAMGILRGEEPGEGIQQLAELGADSSLVLRLQAAWRASRDDLEERAADPTALSSAFGAAYEGQLGVPDVIEMFAQGTLGRGQAAVDNATRMMNVVSDAARTADRGFDQSIAGFQRSLSQFYTDTGIIKNPALQRVEAQAREDLHIRTVVNGEDPMEAYRAVREKFDPIWDQVSGGTPTDTRGAALEAFVAGEANARAVIDAGFTAAEIRELWRSNRLNPRQAESILLEME